MTRKDTHPAIGAIVVIVVPILSLFALLYMFFGRTSDNIISVLMSPDGNHTATIVDRGGDATVGFWRLVAVCEGNQGCTADSNTSVARNNHSGVIKIDWKSKDHLVVYYKRKLGEFEYKETGKDGIKIEYVAIDK